MNTKPLIEYVKDNKVSTDDIERCVDKLKQEILHKSGEFMNENNLLTLIDKWLVVKKPITQSFEGVQIIGRN